MCTNSSRVVCTTSRTMQVAEGNITIRDLGLARKSSPMSSNLLIHIGLRISPHHWGRHLLRVATCCSNAVICSCCLRFYSLHVELETSFGSKRAHRIDILQGPEQHSPGNLDINKHAASCVAPIEGGNHRLTEQQSLSSFLFLHIV